MGLSRFPVDVALNCYILVENPCSTNVHQLDGGHVTPAPLMTASVAELNHTVAMPRAASVRFPVLVVPARRSVVTPAVIVTDDAESL